jgi:glucan 1,3-beta-glucosidase
MISVALSLLVATQGLPKLTVRGTDLVDPHGKKVILRGANLGNWDVIEFWMLGNSGDAGVPGDQFRLEELLTKRFGEAEKDRLMDVYRSSWIRERDFDELKKFRFNFVRLPMNYRLMEDDRHPMQLKPNAFQWIDRAVDLAEQHGMYVLLDMHGAQGGQSPYDHTGHSDQNHLKDSPADQKRLAWLWGKLAARYRNRSAVMGYDSFNEPYGMPKPVQVDVFKQVYAEIRKVDPEKLIFAHGNYDDFSHYGDPKANGWHNVGFQMHYYPGLFGGGNPTVKTHLNHLESLKGIAARVKKLNVPFIIGEMNVVFDAAGGADMMRKTFDAHASYGWLTSMWSAKVMTKEGGLGEGSWGAMTNALPMPKINFETDSKAAIEGYFKGFATQKLKINEPLRKALGNPQYKVKAFVAPAMRTTAPQGSLSGWTGSDIGGALKGGLSGSSEEGFDLFGGGNDIWGANDAFRFLHRTLEGDGVIEVTVNTVEAIDTYTKSGIMLRDGLGANAKFFFVSIFPNGELTVARREQTGGDAAGTEAIKGSLPGITIRLTRKAGSLTVEYKKGDEAYKVAATVADFLPKRVEAGVVALSHSGSELAKVSYQGLVFKAGS